MPAANKNEEWIVNTKQLSRLLGLTPRRVQQLADSGVFQRCIDSDGLAIDGQWSAEICVQAYIRKRENDLSVSDTDEGISNAKLRKMRAEAEAAELRVELMKGDAYPREVIAAIQNDQNTAIRQKLLDFPIRVARLVLGQDDISEVARIIGEKIKEVMIEIKDYNPTDYQVANDSFLKGLIETDDEGNETGDKEISQPIS